MRCYSNFCSEALTLVGSIQIGKKIMPLLQFCVDQCSYKFLLGISYSISQFKLSYKYDLRYYQNIDYSQVVCPTNLVLNYW